MNIQKLLFILSAFLFLILSKNNEAMFDNQPYKYTSSQDLEARKKAMRDTLDDLNRSFQENQTETNLRRISEIAHSINNTTSGTDPELAKRAQNLLQRISAKFHYFH
jgi:hypothetical protein